MAPPMSEFAATQRPYDVRSVRSSSTIPGRTDHSADGARAYHFETIEMPFGVRGLN